MFESFLPLILLYPEIHYRFRYFPFSRYFLKEPEILLDIPYKSKNSAFPVFMIVKDADIFPATVWSVKFHFVMEDGSFIIKTFIINEKITSKIFARTFEIDLEDKRGFVTVSALFQVYIKGKMKELINSNLKGINSELEIYLGDNEELFDNYLQGDLHYHSEFTSDQVEFGAPVDITVKCAEALGLDFFALTDHSYDLDDEEDNYLINDPELKKFERMKQSCTDNTNDRVTVIHGEEVTVRNSKDRNVHLLVYDREFFAGKGDSAEKWLETRSENTIFEVAHPAGHDALVAAAHPFNKTPLLEHLLVRRGKWTAEDVTTNGITHLQILNGVFDDNFFINLSAWTELLLKGEKIFIIAGNDAHGNFNLFRQIGFPMLKLTSKNKQIFGKCRTVAYSVSKKKEDIIEAVKKGHCYITSGPHFIISVRNNSKIYSPGDSFKAEPGDLEAEFFINSSAYSGSIKGIIIYRGSIHSYEEKIIWEKEFIDSLYHFNERIDLTNDNIDHYIRIEIYTSSTHGNGKTLEHRAYSNPIWIMK